MSSATARSASRTASSTVTRSTPGMAATGVRPCGAVDEKQRPDQIIGGQRQFRRPVDASNRPCGCGADGWRGSGAAPAPVRTLASTKRADRRRHGENSFRGRHRAYHEPPAANRGVDVASDGAASRFRHSSNNARSSIGRSRPSAGLDEAAPRAKRLVDHQIVAEPESFDRHAVIGDFAARRSIGRSAAKAAAMRVSRLAATLE